MQRIFFMARHGETDWNLARRWQGHTDIALNARGRAQAAELAARLRRTLASTIGRVVTSDLARSRETGEIVASELGVRELCVEPGLRERSFGVFEGLTVEECELRFPQHWADYRSESRVPPPGAEPFDSVAERMHATLLRLTRHQGSGVTLVVSHGGAMRAFFQSVSGTTFPPLENTALYRFAHAPAGFADVSRIDD